MAGCDLRWMGFVDQIDVNIRLMVEGGTMEMLGVSPWSLAGVSGTALELASCEVFAMVARRLDLCSSSACSASGFLCVLTLFSSAFNRSMIIDLTRVSRWTQYQGCFRTH